MPDSEDQIPTPNITKPLYSADSLKRTVVGIVIIATILGMATGYIMSNKTGGSVALIDSKPKTASQDNRTFRDFAQGTLRAKPATKKADEYVEGSHILTRDGQDPVALTSSVVDLSQYEGKKVKVFGETQKAIQEGWLMDVGKIEEVK